ncbi:MAG: enoyl-CoA hydratase/isomerase family protein [Chloroflexi bacterium]|nr:enoyl-CoA hydratase/isomerase family protein [Chloroflexota bacterium]
MPSDLVRYEVSERIATITINRPEKRNSFTENTRRQLIDHWMTFKYDEDADVAILTGAGNVAWSAGSDLREIGTQIQVDDPDWRPPIEGVSTIGLATMQGLDIDKPVIAAINGYALGFGFALALACDIRICTPNARFACTEVKFGHMAGGGQSTLLPQSVPFGWAMELALTGDQIDAETAQRIGIVNRVVPPEQLMAECRALAHRMVECGPTVVRWTKRFMYRAMGQTYLDALELEGLYYARIRSSKDYDIGTQAFVNAPTLREVRPEFTRH